MGKWYYHYAIVAGLFASAASFFGKFTSQVGNEDTNGSNWLPAIACLTAMIVCNVFVCTCFVKAMHQKGGSLVATVTSTATNYCCSAVIGNLMFDEHLSIRWWCGTLLVILGLAFITLDNTESAINQIEIEKNKRR